MQKSKKKLEIRCEKFIKKIFKATVEFFGRNFRRGLIKLKIPWKFQRNFGNF